MHHSEGERLSPNLRQATHNAARYWSNEMDHASPDPQAALFVYDDLGPRALIYVEVADIAPHTGAFSAGTDVDGCPAGLLQIDPKALKWPAKALENLLRHELGHALGLVHSVMGNVDYLREHPARTTRDKNRSHDVMGMYMFPDDIELEASPEDLRLLWLLRDPIWFVGGDS